MSGSRSSYTEAGAHRYPYREYVRGPKVRLARHVRGCRDASGPRCGGAYTCTKCGRLIGWCNGGVEGSHRDYWCDECWCADERKRERAA